MECPNPLSFIHAFIRDNTLILNFCNQDKHSQPNRALRSKKKDYSEQDTILAREKGCATINNFLHVCKATAYPLEFAYSTVNRERCSHQTSISESRKGLDNSITALGPMCWSLNNLAKFLLFEGSTWNPTCTSNELAFKFTLTFALSTTRVSKNNWDLDALDALAPPRWLCDKVLVALCQ